MLSKQWFEQQSIEILEYTKTISYAIELENGSRKIELTASEANSNLLYAWIRFFEHQIELGTYQPTHLEALEAQTLITNWLTQFIALDVMKNRFTNIEFSSSYEYYLKFGEKAMLKESWDLSKGLLEEYMEYDCVTDNFILLYQLYENSSICTQFYFHIQPELLVLSTDSFYHRKREYEFDFVIETQENCYTIIKTRTFNENGYFVSREEQDRQVFSTPQDAFYYLEPLLAEHLQNT